MNINVYKKTKMQHKGLKLCTVFLLVLGLTGLPAQESINTAGGNASGSGGSVSYSLGQLVYTTNTGSSGSVAQGIQIPYVITEETGIEGTGGISLRVIAYPNPTTDYLTLEVKEFEISNLRFHLYDMQGKLLQNEKIIDYQTSIDMSNLVPSTYFVKVIRGNKEVKTFKIIKK